ncbi:MAG: hypothetical protein PHH93_08760 [Prolixibacteraceae bacterium]|nr:hypothetical protein [Prolixibacteraceae bacterium]
MKYDSSDSLIKIFEIRNNLIPDKKLTAYVSDEFSPVIPFLNNLTLL